MKIFWKAIWRHPCFQVIGWLKIWQVFNLVIWRWRFLENSIFEWQVQFFTQNNRLTSMSCQKWWFLGIFNGFSPEYTYLQNKRMRRCGVAPPPIIFERLQLPQQIIYRRKENLSESPNHQKYWENILVSRFYEQFSRNRRNLGHFRKFKKISNS